MDKTFLISKLINDLRTYDNIQKIVIVQWDNYTTGCLLDYNYFNKYYKMTVMDLNKQKALDADPKVIQQNNVTGNLAWDWNANTKFFNYSRSERNHFLQWYFTMNCKSILILFRFNITSI